MAYRLQGVKGEGTTKTHRGKRKCLAGVSGQARWESFVIVHTGYDILVYSNTGIRVGIAPLELQTNQ